MGCAILEQKAAVIFKTRLNKKKKKQYNEGTTHLYVEIGEEENERDHVAYLEVEPSHREATGPQGRRQGMWNVQKELDLWASDTQTEQSEKVTVAAYRIVILIQSQE